MRRLNNIYNTKYMKSNNVILSHIRNNAREYIIASILFFIGILLGIVFVNNLNEAQTNDITTYITNTITVLKEDNSLNQFQMLKENIKQDIFIVVLLWILGSTVIGLLLVYLIVCFKGFSLGYTISSIIYVMRNRKRNSILYE